MRGLGAGIHSLLQNRGFAGRISRRQPSSGVDPETGSPVPGELVSTDVMYIMWTPSIYRDSVASGFDTFIRSNAGRVYVVAVSSLDVKTTDSFFDADGKRYEIHNASRVANSHTELLVLEV